MIEKHGWRTLPPCSHGPQSSHVNAPLHALLAPTEFFVTETPKGKVVDPRKLSLIKRVSLRDAMQALHAACILRQCGTTTNVCIMRSFDSLILSNLCRSC